MTKYQVVKAAELDAEKLTFEDLRCHFGTGRSYVISGTGEKRDTVLVFRQMLEILKFQNGKC